MGWDQNALFKIASKQYLGHLMTLEGGGRQNALLKIAAKQCLGPLGGGGVFQNA